MPRGDRTGPDGKGPRTGRGLGYCSGSDKPGYEVGMGRGFGRGAGRGLGRGLGVRQNSKDLIKELEAEKALIEKRLKELREE